MEFRVESNMSKSQAFLLLLKMAASAAISYYTLKWLMDQVDPTRKQKIEAKKKASQIMKKLGITGVRLNEYELTIAAHLVDPGSMTVSWTDIAGLEDTINELKETVILPFQKHSMFEGSQLLQPPKGVLLYGPPGCGKTMIAKATAKEAGCRFINLQPSVLTDKWYGESQRLASAVFHLATKIQPAIIFIDEIDSFLRTRQSQDHEATAMMKAEFMSLWDGLATNPRCKVMVMGATNRPQDVDQAILRRMPSRFWINVPNEKQRESILKLILANEVVSEDVDLRKIAEQTDACSGSDLREVCRNASIYRVRDLMKEEKAKEKEQEDKQEQQQTDEQKVQDEAGATGGAVEGAVGGATAKPEETQPENGQPTLRPITMADLQLAVNKLKETKNTASDHTRNMYS
ncbi:outer mitochondrial transmembrane helix translocase-like [Branchiostoma lanceolatum]|uniref:outer mitochondrial transmembrane helix translocase-like n=1 Tax=Branchiostoma lanceolatum TaxID=7740 RepID=UPI0034525F08